MRKEEVPHRAVLKPQAMGAEVRAWAILGSPMCAYSIIKDLASIHEAYIVC